MPFLRGINNIYSVLPRHEWHHQILPHHCVAAINLLIAQFLNMNSSGFTNAFCSFYISHLRLSCILFLFLFLRFSGCFSFHFEGGGRFFISCYQRLYNVSSFCCTVLRIFIPWHLKSLYCHLNFFWNETINNSIDCKLIVRSLITWYHELWTTNKFY